MNSETALEMSESLEPKSDTPSEKSAAVDLTVPGNRSLIARRILKEIEDWAVAEFDDGPRNHLGGSLIGNECRAYLWFVYRWTFREKFTGRMLRLFNRGHREEDRYVQYLRGIGFTVFTHDTSKPKNEKGEYPQFRVSGSGGHFGGSLDGIGYFPPRYGIEEPILLEFKTNNTGASWNKLETSGVAYAKEMHFAQMSTYGSHPDYNFKYAAYFNTNKNDESLYPEIVALDHNLGRQMYEKADQIILSQKRPARLSDNPTWRDCQYCAAKEICHGGALPLKNCRSCPHAVPVDGAQWYCNSHAAIIPKDVIREGCERWIPITNVD
jgi:hypothetical protein